MKPTAPPRPRPRPQGAPPPRALRRRRGGGRAESSRLRTCGAARPRSSRLRNGRRRTSQGRGERFPEAGSAARLPRPGPRSRAGPGLLSAPQVGAAGQRPAHLKSPVLSPAPRSALSVPLALGNYARLSSLSLPPRAPPGPQKRARSPGARCPGVGGGARAPPLRAPHAEWHGLRFGPEALGPVRLCPRGCVR